MPIAHDVVTFERQAERLFVIYREHMGRVCASAGLTRTQYWALYTISELNETRMSPLAECLGLTPGAASTLIDRLVDMGFVERSANAADRRVVSVHLTEKGLACLSKARDEKRELLRSVIGKLAPEKRSQLLAGLDAILGAWEPLTEEELTS